MLKLFKTSGCLFVLVLLLLGRTNSTKWLIENPGFNNPENWLSGYLPCSLEEIVFPEDYAAILPLPKEVDVGGIVLPKEGAILLQQESTLTLGGDIKDRKCEDGNSRKAFIKKPNTKKWFDPNTWRTTDDMTQNKAIPHLERVPCNNESIIIQRNGPLSLDLENVPFMRLGQLSLAGSLISRDYLELLFSTDLGQILFKNSATSKVEYYRNDVCGCHKDYSSFVEPICHNIVATCARPHCLVPITPFGSCCAICGSMLKFTVDECSDENLLKLRKLIAMAVSEKELTDELDFQVSYINTAHNGKFLQAIVVDRNSYNEKSVDFMNQLNVTTDWTKLFASFHQLDLQYSGRPYNPNITFGSIVLIILCLIFVSIVGLVIFAHFAPDNRYLNRIPQWVYEPRRWRDFILRSNLVFARFDNTATGVVEGNMQESIIMGYDAESGEVRERAFDNPMFGEKTAHVKKDTKETSRKNDNLPTTSVGPAENVTLTEKTVVEEQELTEIKLESSSDESEQEDIIQ